MLLDTPSIRLLGRCNFGVLCYVCSGGIRRGGVFDQHFDDITVRSIIGDLIAVSVDGDR